MKKIRLTLLTMFLLLLMSIPVQAQTYQPEANIEYLSNGDYIETVITTDPQLVRASSRSGSKTSTYKNSAGASMWSVTVKGKFSYTGKNSKCTSVSGTVTSYSSKWKVSSPSTSKSGNKATATATGKHYSGSSLLGSYSRTVTLSCDKNGNLS